MLWNHVQSRWRWITRALWYAFCCAFFYEMNCLITYSFWLGIWAWWACNYIDLPISSARRPQNMSAMSSLQRRALSSSLQKTGGISSYELWTSIHVFPKWKDLAFLLLNLTNKDTFVWLKKLNNFGISYYTRPEKLNDARDPLPGLCIFFMTVT